MENSPLDWRIPLPPIRNVNPIAAVHNQQQVYYLQDPLQLSETSILIPQELGAIFMLCDGTRTVQSIQSSLRSIFGIQTSLQELMQLFQALDQAFLFENKNFKRAYASALQAFRAAPSRPPTHAGVSYPSDPDELAKLLRSFNAPTEKETNGNAIRGLVSPHIDFERGGGTYAHAWTALTPTIGDVELAIILGTDHHGAGEVFTLTRQDYATPFGTLPTFQPGVDLLVDVFGEEASFSGELRHRSEHSIEFAAVWLHHIRAGDPCPILPILCDALPADDGPDTPQAEASAQLTRAIDELRNLIETKRTLVIAAGDLSHVGPAFQGEPVQGDDLDQLSVIDHAYIQKIEQGDAAELHRMIRERENQTNVCGTAPFVHALNMLAPTKGELRDYQQCIADPHKTSWVSICGMHLY